MTTQSLIMFTQAQSHFSQLSSFIGQRLCCFYQNWERSYHSIWLECWQTIKLTLISVSENIITEITGMLLCVQRGAMFDLIPCIWYMCVSLIVYIWVPKRCLQLQIPRAIRQMGYLCRNVTIDKWEGNEWWTFEWLFLQLYLIESWFKRMGRKSACPVCYVQEPRTLIVKEKGLAPVFLDEAAIYCAGAIEWDFQILCAL